MIVTGTNAQKSEAVKCKLPRITIELADMRDRQAIDELFYNYPDYLGSQLDLLHKQMFAPLGSVFKPGYPPKSLLKRGLRLNFPPLLRGVRGDRRGGRKEELKRGFRRHSRI